MFFYNAHVNFRTDERPACCPYYFLKNNECEGMFLYFKKVTISHAHFVESCLNVHNIQNPDGFTVQLLFMGIYMCIGFSSEWKDVC